MPVRRTSYNIRSGVDLRVQGGARDRRQTTMITSRDATGRTAKHRACLRERFPRRAVDSPPCDGWRRPQGKGMLLCRETCIRAASKSRGSCGNVEVSR